jgi:hypothetical protein
MKTENELIAEFMGFTFVPASKNGLVNNHYEKGNDWMDTGHMQYHASWDWLMPVYKKCYDIWTSEHLSNEECKDIFEDIWLHLWKCDIENTFHWIVEFIKWYNENKAGNETKNT